MTSTEAGARVSTLAKYEIVDIGAVKPAKRNARTHDEAQITALVRSIETFGAINPIIVDEDFRIVAGHARYEALKRLGVTRVPILRVGHLSPDELRLYAIADNRIAERSGWDENILAIEFSELEVALPEISLAVSGFELPKIDLLVTAPEQTSWTDLDRAPAEPDQRSPVTRPGDIWEFGDAHRLICGDSTDPDVLGQLLEDGRVRLIATDPPYNLKAREYSGNGRHRHGDFQMGAGELSRDEFVGFLAKALAAAASHLLEGALVYAFMDWKHIRDLIEAADTNGLVLVNLCVWDKLKGGMGSFYRSAHELVGVFRHGDVNHCNRIELGRHGRNRTNLWRYEGFNSFAKGRDRALAMHGTVKPVQMICDLILDASERGDVVFDGFGGSGTTLIAAEKTGRRARLVELDPKYCDTIVRRFEHAFGIKATHLQSGLSFSELRNSRDGEDPSDER